MCTPQPDPALDPQVVRTTDLKTQIVRFTISGGLAAIVDYGLLRILMLAGLDATVAKAISFVFGTLTAYAINRRWTFAAAPSTKRFLATMAVYAVMFGVQVGIFHVLFGLMTGSWDWSDGVASTIAFVIAQGVATVTNFVVQRTIIFRAH